MRGTGSGEGFTYTVLAGEDRVEELTRMLGGKAESAREHARNLLADRA